MDQDILRQDTLRTAAGIFGGVTTAYLDVSRTDAQGAREVETRWRRVRDRLTEEGAPTRVVDALEERMLEPTERGGQVTRVIVADEAGEVVVDATVDGALESRGHHGGIAHVAALARAHARRVRHAVVLVDSAGADVSLVDTLDGAEEEHEVEGDHDVLNKVRGGGLAHRRLQARVEDSVERNAQHVATELDRLVVSERPDLVLVAGDEHAVNQLVEHAGGAVTERLHRLEHGSRAPGASGGRMELDAAAAVRQWRRERRQRVLDRLLAAGGGVVGLGETVEALRRGAVETLVLADDVVAGRSAAGGPDPMQLALDADELHALGVEEPEVDDAEEVLVRAALGQGATLEPLAGPVEGLEDGIGAVLRFDTRPGAGT